MNRNCVWPPNSSEPAPPRCPRFGAVARCGVLLAALWGLSWSSPSVLGQSPPNRATTSRAARDDAVRSIPFDKLSDESRTKAAYVVRNAGLFRRLPIEVIDCDPDLYLFLVRNPDVVVDMWRVMGISRLTMERQADGRFRCADGDGTTGHVEILHSTHDTQVVYSEGIYEGPLLPRAVRGQCLLILRSGYMREPDGRYYVTNRLDAFLNVENVGVGLLAKTFHPVVGRMADFNFTETAGFVSSLSRTAERNPTGVGRLSERLTNVDAARRQRLAELAASVAQRANAALAHEPARAPLPVRQAGGAVRWEQ